MILKSIESVATRENGKYNHFKNEKTLNSFSIKDINQYVATRKSMSGLIETHNLKVEKDFAEMDIVMYSAMLVKLTYTSYPSINIQFCSDAYMKEQQTLHRTDLVKKYAFENYELITEKGNYSVKLETQEDTIIDKIYCNYAKAPDKTKNYSSAEIKILREKDTNKIVVLDVRMYLDKREYTTIEQVQAELETFMDVEHKNSLSWITI